jgi:hypothetical protein
MPIAAPLTPPVVPLSRCGGSNRRSSAVRTLLERARQALLDAEYSANPVDRYAKAQLAALRAAAAVLAARARPRHRCRPTSAWVLLPTVAPELAEWSAHFAATSATRSAAEAGVRRRVTTRDADDLIRQTSEFLTLAQDAASGSSR